MTTNISSPSEESIQTAVKLLKEGEIVAFPTETVYGLGASIFDSHAIQKIFDVKGRPSDNPLIAHISSMIQTDLIADNIPKLFYTLADHFFPGPLTIVVPKKKAVPDIASAHLTTIGIRMPNHPIAWKLIEQFGTPLVAPSANLSGRPSPTTAQDVLEDMKGKIPLILDGGPCRVGIESTVIDVTTSTPTILRPGHITRDQIEQVIRQPVQTLLTNKQLEIVKAPGMKYRHYAPDAMIYCITTLEELRELLKNPDLSQAMMMTNIHLPLQFSFPFVVPIEEQTLFSNFRIADRKKVKHIIIFLDDDTKRNSGLINRIEKATTKV